MKNTDLRAYQLCTKILQSRTIDKELLIQACDLRDLLTGLFSEIECGNGVKKIIPQIIVNDIIDELKKGSKIRAIKILREFTYLNLIDAKNVIEKSPVFAIKIKQRRGRKI